MLTKITNPAINKAKRLRLSYICLSINTRWTLVTLGNVSCNLCRNKFGRVQILWTKWNQSNFTKRRLYLISFPAFAPFLSLTNTVWSEGSGNSALLVCHSWCPILMNCRCYFFQTTFPGCSKRPGLLKNRTTLIADCKWIAGVSLKCIASGFSASIESQDDENLQLLTDNE